MSNAAIRVSNSLAVHEPFAPDLRLFRRKVAQFFPQSYVDDRTASQDIPFEVDMILRILERIESATSLTWPMSWQSVGTQRAESASNALVTRRAKREAAVQLLRSWREGNKQEQQETWEYLRRSLDEDRLSSRKLFP